MRQHRLRSGIAFGAPAFRGNGKSDRMGYGIGLERTRHATFTQMPGGPVKTYKDCISIFRMLARSPSQCSSERAQICALGTSWSR